MTKVVFYLQFSLGILPPQKSHNFQTITPPRYLLKLKIYYQLFTSGFQSTPLPQEVIRPQQGMMDLLRLILGFVEIGLVILANLTYP